VTVIVWSVRCGSPVMVVVVILLDRDKICNAVSVNSRVREYISTATTTMKSGQTSRKILKGIIVVVDDERGSVLYYRRYYDPKWDGSVGSCYKGGNGVSKVHWGHKSAVVAVRGEETLSKEKFNV